MGSNKVCDLAVGFGRHSVFFLRPAAAGKAGETA